MPPLDAVRQRLASEPAFRRHLLAEPASALEPYPLTGAEVLVLANELDETRADTDVAGYRSLFAPG